ncbi:MULTISPECIES: LuxR C-terminal-related transcriptional regulator [unclassified Serratia (in: enterobacteria)]|uniref:LuxR C-terminal-related transcriptional regulator n=1 Tax=unclassified Serratia (in: enterobacteria) TaxID=2647522 RepID=UPI003076114E
MESRSSNFNVVISTPDPLTRLGMKKIALMSVPDCKVYSDINSISTALFTVLNVSANLLVADIYDDSGSQEENEALLLSLCHHHPSLKIIIYTQSLTPEAHTLLQNCPQVSFLSRKAPLQEVYQVFAIVLGGGRYYNPSVRPKRVSTVNGVDVLTVSEKRVLSLLLKGYSQGQIARLLTRSIKTISAQKCSMIKKLGCKRDSEIFLMKDTLLSSLS